jgi:cell division protein FtsN
VSSNYRPNPVKKKSAMSPMITGIVIGLLLGVLLALGFAIWLNRHATPFVEKSKAVELLPTRPARPDAPKSDVAQPTPTTAAGVANEVAKSGGDKPRFEFYQTLPGNKDNTRDGSKDGKSAKSLEAVPKTVAKAEPTAKAASNAAGDASKDATKPPSKESYSLQAGAFQSESDAENLKAKIAFAGMEATVRSVNLPDKGTLYRVRLGPYRSLDEVNRIKAALSQNGISAAVVKPE